ncbi:MAG TPA: hypothetical protein VN033_03495 [Vulgatibacter sp.]|nr:hypothetical protein [Vulgatibacter sp.]
MIGIVDFSRFDGLDPWRVLGFFALIAFLLYRNLPGALAFAWPGWVRLRAAGGPDDVVARGPAMRDMLGQLEALGFERKGVVIERRPLARAARDLVLASPDARCFATVRQVRNEAWLSLVTHFSDGAAVITADFHWPSVDEADYLAGGLPGNGPAELVNAHRRRVQRFVDEGRPLDARFDLEALEEAGSRFYAKGPGKRELRRKEIRGVIFAGGALIFMGSFLVQLARRLAG